MGKVKSSVVTVNPTELVGLSALSALSLQAVTAVINTLESKVSSEVNITNWKAQILGNQKVKYAVTTTLTKAAETVTVTTVNFQPARKLNLKGLVFSNVNGSKEDAPAIMDKYAQASLPNNSKEIAALLGYLLVSNLTGKAISAVSGGRALLLQEILNTLAPDTLEIKISEATSGGQGDHFNTSLDLATVRRIADGGAWRGELVTALKAGSKSTKADKDDYKPDMTAEEWA
jgi:hypothetical protein